MKYLSSHIRTAAVILNRYDGLVPLAVFLKDFYREHKNMGSRDRKTVSHICYCYYRCFHLIKDEDLELAIVKALHCCVQAGNEYLRLVDLNELPQKEKPGIEKWHWPEIEESRIFPYTTYLSESIDAGSFARSLLIQPDLFLRIRPSHQQKVLARLAEDGPVIIEENNAVRLNNTVNVQEKIIVNTEAVIQDFNSQQVLDYFDKIIQPGTTYNVWDCCAASGGKSILAADKLKDSIKLTVSDIRKSILEKLQVRLATAGVEISRRFVADLSLPYTAAENFDIIIADMPCTGSGTWSRTPELLAFFNPRQVKAYSNKQYAIATNVLPALKAGGFLFYITCSVFKDENETTVARIVKEHNLDMLHMQYLKGYHIKSDSLFVAVLRKPAIGAETSG